MKILRWIPSALLCLFIFSQSMKTGSESSELSLSIVQWLYPFFSFLSEDSFHFLIRKAAHFTEFFLLGCSLKWPCAKDFRKYLIFCFLIPICDETIQLFAEGRAAQATDCLIDASGMIFAWMSIQFFLVRRKTT